MRPGLLFLVSAGVSRRPFRSLIITLSVAILTALLASSALIDRASRAGLDRGLKRLGADLVAVPRGLDQDVARSYLSGKPSTFYMDEELEDRITGFRFVERTSAQVFIRSLTGASCCSAWNVFLIGFEPATDFTVRPWLDADSDRSVGPNQVLVGAAFDLAPGDTVRFYGQVFSVAGRLDPTGMGLDSAVFIPLESVRLMALESPGKALAPLELSPRAISAVSIRLRPEADGGLPPYRAAYELEQAVPEISVLQPDELLVKTQANLARVLAGLRAGSYAVWPLTALLAGLVFALAANERTRELGLLRAMGARRSFVFGLIFLEAMGLAAAGAVVGLGLSAASVLMFSRLIAARYEVPMATPGTVELAWVLAGAAVLAIAAGIAAALYPAARAAAQEPYEAMRRAE